MPSRLLPTQIQLFFFALGSDCLWWTPDKQVMGWEGPKLPLIRYFDATEANRGMAEHFSRSARTLGIGSAATILVVGLAYAFALTLGFANLTTADSPISDPYFSVMEVLILMLAPTMVALMAAVHAWAPDHQKVFSLTALCFTAMLATLTCSVHFLILALGRRSGLIDPAVTDAFLAFKWPSVVYALDVLGWDFFFALAMLFAAPAFRGGGLNRAIRFSMIISGLLALAGLIGVPSGDMMLRNIGIAGYLGAFLVVDGLLLSLFLRPHSAPPRAQ